MGLFDRTCAVCGQAVPRKHAVSYDETLDRLYPAGLEEYVCRECAFRLLRAAAEAFRGRAIAIAPSRRFPAYFFVSAERLARHAEERAAGGGFGYSDEFRDQLSSWRPAADATCARCGRPAPFLWASLEILGGDPYEGFVDLNGLFESENLCGACLVERLRAHLDAEGFELGHVEPPSDPDGIVWIPQEW